MSDPVAIAAIAAIAGMGTVFSPLILSHMAARARRTEKQLDWAREDKVAAQAAEAAALLLARQDAVAAQAAEAARLLLAANERVARTAAVTNRKLDVIHTLVNSNLTAAMQAEHDATVRTLAMMREVVDLRRAAGNEPSPETLAAIEATETRIGEQTAALDDRLAQTALAEQQQADAEETEDKGDQS
jgi:CO dehydrogenase/acetyl-CoA synthase alpha subunit